MPSQRLATGAPTFRACAVRVCASQQLRFDSDEDFQATARKAVVALQAGDERSIRAWKLLCAQSETFSFATVVWEMAAHRKPFDDTLPEHLPRALNNGHRPPIKKKWPEELQQVLRQCWELDPNIRPPPREVEPKLRALHEIVEAEEASKPKKRVFGLC